MKLLSTLVVFCLAALSAVAQDTKLTISSCFTAQAQSGYPLTQSYDNNTSTFWHSPWGTTTTTFPVTITYCLSKESHVDYIRYTPRQDGNSNGNWQRITVKVSTGTSTTTNTGWTDAVSLNLGGSSSVSDIALGDDGLDGVRTVRIVIESGQAGFASAAEVAFYQRDNSKQEAFRPYFSDALCTTLRPEITSSEGIDDPDVKALVDALLDHSDAYKKFRVGEYEAYRTTSSLQAELRNSAQYCNYENPTGIYATKNQPLYLFMEGIGDYPVKLTVKNWVVNEQRSDYALRNGLNVIVPTTTGNTFINYYTDDFATAPHVRAHFACGKVQGYFDKQTMTNDDWREIMALHPSATDSTVIICRSEHAQTAYPAFIYRQHCPTNIDSLMTLYEQVQWAERDMMGLTRYGREAKNRQLFIGTTYGFMAAGGEFAFCNVGSLGAITKPDAAQFDFWGVGHEWGHNNQIQPGFKWSGCGETTNNIYASWAQIHFNGGRYLRLEDEVTGVNDYSGMRGGRMEVYFEEGLRKGVQWQLQDGPDYHGAAATGANNSRNYDHFVKLVPFWQLNLWGTLAGKCPYIIPKVIEGLRTTPKATLQNMDNGKMQMNWMTMACDSAGLDLTPFFERAGMLKVINAYIEDYGAGWNRISAAQIKTLKKHCQDMGYPVPAEEVNYITGYNYPIYRDCLPLEVPQTLNEGCTLNGSLVKVLHSKVKNAVAYETYNSVDSLIRITMYALGSDNAHSYTQVLYPGAEDAAYIVAVGYDGTRQRIYEFSVPQLRKSRYYTLRSKSKGGYLTTKNCALSKDGTLTQNVARVSTLDAKDAGAIWWAEEYNGQMRLLNPQSGLYIGGTANTAFSEFVSEASAPIFAANAVDVDRNEWTLALNAGGQYLNAYSNTNTGFWSGGANDANNIWEVCEATTLSVNIPSIGMRAACYPFALTLPEGYCAYEPTELSVSGDTTYVLAAQTLGQDIPARMPVVISGPSGNAVCQINANGSALAHEPLLEGVGLKRTGYTAGDFLSLSRDKNTERIGFNLSTATTMTANFAYLMADKTTATSTVILLGSAATGIESLQSGTAENPSAPLYDLQGRRLARPAHSGLYIRNGHKVVVK